MSATNTLNPETSSAYQKINLIPQNAQIWVPPSDSLVTIDWVVLSAAIIGIGMLVLTPIALSTDSVSQSVANAIGGLHSCYGHNN